MLNRVLETLDNGVAIIDADNKIVSHNTAFNAQWGLPQTTCLKTSALSDVIDFNDLQSSKQWKEAFQGYGVQRIEDVYYSEKRGKEVAIDWSLDPLIDQDGSVRSVVLQCRVLKPIETELRRARAEKERLSYALSGAQDGIWDWDFVSGRVYFSDRYSGMLGYEHGELQHSFKTWESLVHPDDFKAAKATITEYINSGQELYRNRFRMLHKKGHEVWILARGQIVEYASDGSPRRIAGTHTDVSDQVELEAQLLSAKSQAEDAAEAERVFLSTISHEIRTPLTGLIGMLDTLDESGLETPDAERLGTAKNSASTLLGILNSVLDLSELKAGTFRLERRDFNIKDMLERAVAVYEPLASAKDICLDLELKPSANRWANSDPERISQILFNLISNAVKFSDNGAIKITASCLDSENCNQGMDLHLTVRDSGIGISPSEIDHIFERFYQSDQSLERRFQGSGLGLNIVSEILSAMNGSINVSSAIGEGTTFHIQIPIAMGEYAAGQKAPVKTSVDLTGKHILVAEDIDVNKKILSHYLQKMACDVEFVSNGEEAVEACGLSQYDLVLMDIQMPKTNGVEATRRILKQYPSYAEIPIIALTANVFANDVKSYFDAGMRDHIAKPFSYDELVKVLQTHLNETAETPAHERADANGHDQIASQHKQQRSTH